MSDGRLGEALRRGSNCEVDDNEKCGFGCTAPRLFRREAKAGSRASCSTASVFSLVACGGGCTRGPVAAFCAGADDAVVVVFVGGLEGYLRAAEPAAAFAPLDAEAPIVFIFGALWVVFCWE